jgi:hypothetical protein
MCVLSVIPGIALYIGILPLLKGRVLHTAPIQVPDPSIFFSILLGHMIHILFIKYELNGLVFEHESHGNIVAKQEANKNSKIKQFKD